MAIQRLAGSEGGQSYHQEIIKASIQYHVSAPPAMRHIIGPSASSKSRWHWSLSRSWAFSGHLCPHIRPPRVFELHSRVWWSGTTVHTEASICQLRFTLKISLRFGWSEAMLFRKTWSAGCETGDRIRKKTYSLGVGTRRIQSQVWAFLCHKQLIFNKFVLPSIGVVAPDYLNPVIYHVIYLLNLSLPFFVNHNPAAVLVEPPRLSTVCGKCL